GVIQTKFAESFGVAKSSVSQWCSNTVHPFLNCMKLLMLLAVTFGI
ncbi:MAG: transcriptional regulator, partial [Chitinophagia bacterium]|nr:transcriptional regulator [Chitinophagia bacterium]